MIFSAIVGLCPGRQREDRAERENEVEAGTVEVEKRCRGSGDMDGDPWR